MMRRFYRPSLFLIAAALLAPVARASLIGDQVTAAMNYTGDSANGTVAAGTSDLFGINATFSGARFLFDFEANSVSIAMQTPFLSTGYGNSVGSFVIALTDLFPADEQITGLSLGAISGATGVAIGNFSFLAHSVAFDVGGTTWHNGDSVVLNFETREVQPPVVPEPATLSLLGFGCAGASFLRRRLS